MSDRDDDITEEDLYRKASTLYGRGDLARDEFEDELARHHERRRLAALEVEDEPTAPPLTISERQALLQAVSDAGPALALDAESARAVLNQVMPPKQWRALERQARDINKAHRRGGCPPGCDEHREAWEAIEKVNAAALRRGKKHADEAMVGSVYGEGDADEADLSPEHLRKLRGG